MNKMKRIFSFVLAFFITLGAFSSFSTIALADKVEEAKEEATKVEEKEEAKEEEKEEEEAKPEEGKDSTEFLDKLPSDVKGTKYEEAVARLVAFGVIGGYPDGTYKPEREVNRAQFAKIIVEALGLDDANQATIEGSTGFTDVKPGYWAAGYINIASSQGLIKGFPDGTFRPAAKVTYAQALTILVRALGYEDQFLYGNWPSNYISKAADLGITKAADIPANYNEGALRGNIALLVDKTLHKNVIKVTKYEGTAITYEPTETPLMKEKLNIDLLKKNRIVGDQFVDSSLKEKEVYLSKYDEKTKKYVEEKASMKNSAVQYRQFIGKKVNAYKKDKDILIIEDADESIAKFDFVQDAYNVRKDELEVELAAHDNKFRLSEDAVFYVFNEKDSRYEKYQGKDRVTDKLAEGLKGRVGRIVVDGGDIVYGEIMSDKLVSEDFMVVKEVKEDKIKGISPTRADDVLDFSKASKFKGVYVFDQNGKKIDVKDIKAGDVAYAQKQYFDRYDQLFIVVVQDNNVTGDLGRVTEERMEIGKETEYIAKTKETRGVKEKVIGEVSLDLLESSQEYNKDLASELYKEDVIAYRGAGDLVVMLAANDEGAGAKYGIITRVDDRDGRVTITTTLDDKKMETTRFTLENDDDIWDGSLNIVNVEGKASNKGEYKDIITGNSVKPEDALLGQPVRFRVNKDDRIAKGSLRLLNKDAKIENEGNVRFTNNVIHLEKGKSLDETRNKDTKSYKVSPNTKVIEAYGLDFDKVAKGDYEVRDLRDVADNTVIYDYKDIAMTETNKGLDIALFTRVNGEVEAVVLFGKEVDKLTDVRSAEEAIIVTDLGRRGDDYSAKYHSYQAGKQTDKDENFKDAKVAEGGLAIIDINRRGRITVLDDEKLSDDSLYKGIEKNVKVHEINERTDEIVIGKKEVVKVANGAVIYDNSGRNLEEMRLRDIKADDEISYILTKEGVAEVIVREKSEDSLSGGGGGSSTGKDNIITYRDGTTIIVNNRKYELIADAKKYKDDLKVGQKITFEALEDENEIHTIKTIDGKPVEEIDLEKGAEKAIKKADKAVKAVKAVKDEDEKIKAIKKAEEAIKDAKEAIEEVKDEDAKKAFEEEIKGIQEDLDELAEDIVKELKKELEDLKQLGEDIEGLSEKLEDLKKLLAIEEK